jgi:hypothetical protein
LAQAYFDVNEKELERNIATADRDVAKAKLRVLEANNAPGSQRAEAKRYDSVLVEGCREAHTCPHAHTRIPKHEGIHAHISECIHQKHINTRVRTYIHAHSKAQLESTCRCADVRVRVGVRAHAYACTHAHARASGLVSTHEGQLCGMYV